jgi:hypothetical protein
MGKKRTLISLEAADKAWLDQYAKEHDRSQSDVVREALATYRQMKAPDQESFEEILRKTSGTWTQGDALEYLEKLRKDWEREWDRDQ